MAYPKKKLYVLGGLKFRSETFFYASSLLISITMDMVYLWAWLIFTSHYINQRISFFAIQSVAFFLTWY
jgi:hypothetical protein